MKIIDWLMTDDYAIKRMTSKYLLNKEIEYAQEGHIKRYIDLYNENEKTWGGGIYSPKWISTHYTMLELKDMEVDASIAPYQNSIGILIDDLWRPATNEKPYPNYDMCILGMLISLSCYGKSQDQRVYEMIDEALAHQMSDGGWNCYWNYKRRPSIRGSVHTTLTMLEAFRDFGKFDRAYRVSEIKKQVEIAQEYLLSRQLLYSITNGELLHPSFKTAHYPPRWKYDYLRALEYFASIDYDYDQRMDAALSILERSFDRYGCVLKGAYHSGLIHYKLEETKSGRFNTLRGLKVLKKYRPERYKEIINTEYDNFK